MFTLPHHEKMIAEAIEMIQARKLDVIRCSLTGEAYATIHESEIRLTLSMDLAVEMIQSAEALLDRWEIRHWTLCSRPAPSFRLMNEESLGVFLHADSGRTRPLLTYLVGRLIYPSGVKTFNGRWTEAERIEFVISFRDRLDEASDETIDELLTILSTIDSVKNIALWQTQSSWRAAYRGKVQKLRDFYADDWSLTLLKELLDVLYADVMKWLMQTDSIDLYISKTGNRMTGGLISELARKKLNRDQSIARLNARGDQVTKRSGAKVVFELEKEFERRVVDGDIPAVPQKIKSLAAAIRRDNPTAAKASKPTASRKPKSARALQNAKVAALFSAMLDGQGKDNKLDSSSGEFDPTMPIEKK